MDLASLLMSGTSPISATTGAMGMSDVDALSKALQAGYGSDVAQLTGGGALRVQSLDMTMQATIQENRHFRLFNKIPKPKASATVDEWTEQSGVGGFLGGSTNSEIGQITQATGEYARRVGQVKYLSTQRQVSLVSQMQDNMVDPQSVEYTNGAKQLLSDAEYLSFEGDSAVVPTEFDGIYSQISKGVAAGTVDGDNLLDCRGASLSGVNLVNKAAATISKYGNFGTPTDIFFSQETQADFDTGLDPAFRVPLTDVPGGGISIGSPVVGIRTSWGNIATQPDVFVRDSDMRQPFEIGFPAVANAQAGLKPAVAVAALAAANTQSQFTAQQAGNYYYYVTGTNLSGQSTGVVSDQVAVAAGMGATLTISRSAAAQETGYVIYRSRLNGGNVIAGSVPGEGSDFREVCRIACAGATTVWTDLNQDIPGTTKGFILNLTKGDTALLWRQMMPMIRFALYPTNAAVIPWAQLLFGYLRISKLRQHVAIKNILPNGSIWRPFGS
ncbi:MAG: hypothetical protein ABF876_05145 [Acetobacter aceti]